jgi:hypothetical protein
MYQFKLNENMDIKENSSMDDELHVIFPIATITTRSPCS